MLGKMSEKQNELEGRLDDLLSRISNETQEIKELEQQLTDGQILVNEALQKDLEEVISGLQEYLRGLREQARRSQQQVHRLQAENHSLQLHLEDVQRHCRCLEDSARTHTQDISVQQEELSALRVEAQALRDRQAQSGRRQVDLEAELLLLREELSRQATMGQAAADNERHSRDIRESELRSTINMLQEDKSSLQNEVQKLQVRLVQTRNLLNRFTATLSEPQEVQRGAEEAEEDTSSPISPDLMLARNLDRLCRMVRQTGTNRQFQRANIHSQEHIPQAQLDRNQPEAQVIQDQADHFEEQESGDGKLKEELQRSQRRSKLMQQNLAASLGSQGTQDSGLGMQYFSSPDKGRQQQDRPPTGGGYWVYVPPTHTDSGWRDSEGGDADGRSGGATPHPTDPVASDGQMPPFGPTWLLYGSPTAVVYSPPAGGAVLHRDMQGERCVCECEAEKKRLRLEAKKLRRTLRQHRSVTELCDEVECVEKTLLKRRAELREADRKLLEAQSCIHTCRAQASEAREEAAMLQLRAEDGTTCLLDAAQQVRELQEEVEQLKRRKREEEQMLKEVEEVLRTREKELRQLDKEIQRASDTLADLVSDSQEAQRRLDSLSLQKEEQELRLLQRKEEHVTAVRSMEEVREEEQRLHILIKELLYQQEVLVRGKRSEEERLISLKAELSTLRGELKQVLQELLAEQQAMEDAKTKRTQTLKQLQEKQEEVERVRYKLDELKQEVDSHRREAEAHLQNKNQQQAELQEVQEELSRSREKRSSLQDQCKHLEARRRHADRCLSAVQAELATKKEEHSQAHLLQQETMREAAANQEQLSRSAEMLSLLSQQVEEKKRHLQTVEQTLDDVKATVSQLEDRGRRLSRKQPQLNQLSEELLHKEDELNQQREELKRRKKALKQEDEQLQVELKQKREELKQRKEGLKQQGVELNVQKSELKLQREELHVEKEGLHKRHEELHMKEKVQQKEEELHMKEKVQQKEEELRTKQDSREESSEDEEESFYLSTAGLRSAFSSDEERWRIELQREELRQHEDHLKARLRCRLWNQQDNLETDETLQGLKTRVDQLDSLLTHSP